jgi:putative tricarboxylic transport membrane protein
MDHLRVPDRAIGVVVFLLAAGYLLMARQIPDFALAVDMQSNAMPTALGGVLLLLGAALALGGSRASADGDAGVPGSGLVESAAATRARHPTAVADRTDVVVVVERTTVAEATAAAEPTETRRIVTLLVVTLISIVAYIALFVPLGFLLSSVMYVSVMSWYYGYRRPVVIAVVALGSAGLLQVLISEVLGVALPSGPLPGLG